MPANIMSGQASPVAHLTIVIMIMIIVIVISTLNWLWKQKGVFFDRDLPEEDKQALEDVPEVVVSLNGSEGVHHLGKHDYIKLEI